MTNREKLMNRILEQLHSDGYTEGCNEGKGLNKACYKVDKALKAILELESEDAKGWAKEAIASNKLAKKLDKAEQEIARYKEALETIAKSNIFLTPQIDFARIAQQALTKG